MVLLRTMIIPSSLYGGGRFSLSLPYGGGRFSLSFPYGGGRFSRLHRLVKSHSLGVTHTPLTPL